MLELTPTLETTQETAVVDVRSQVADWTDAPAAQTAPRSTQSDPATGVKVGGDGPAIIDRVNVLMQEFRTTARLPVGRPILIGGMSTEPRQAGPDTAQLYLVIQLTAGK
jgi:hypothetical protein